MKILPGIHRFEAPLEGLGDTISVYLLEGPCGSILIDTGWDAPGVRERLLQQFEADGVDCSSITDIVLTHVHTDHYGLASEFQARSGARIVMHALEDASIDLQYDAPALQRECAKSMAWNGMAPDMEHLREWTTGFAAKMSGLPRADRMVDDGDVISNGRFELRVLWTPGHSPGHICLYEPHTRTLFSGDHVLPHMAPNVGAAPHNSRNPLSAFITSLRKVREIQVETVCPAHGRPFFGLEPRLDSLLRHHEQRENEVLGILNCSPQTAREIAGRITWMKERGGLSFDLMGARDKRLAMFETISYLEHLGGKGKTATVRLNGHVAHVLAGC